MNRDSDLAIHHTRGTVLGSVHGFRFVDNIEDLDSSRAAGCGHHSAPLAACSNGRCHLATLTPHVLPDVSSRRRYLLLRSAKF